MSVPFELLRFEATPATGAVAVVELDGRFGGPAPARVRLLVERRDTAVEVPAVDAGGEDPWTASFALELEALDDDATQFSLAPGRGPLIALPTPTVTGGPGDDRFVRLARQANELRHRLGEAIAASTAREQVGDELAADRDRLKEELAAAERRAEDELAAAERRAQSAEESAQAARDQRDSATASADAAREELGPLHEQLRDAESRANEAERDRAALRARAEAAERSAAEQRDAAAAAQAAAGDASARLVAAEDELRLMRRDLRDTRARIEALVREQRRHQPAARRGHEVPEPGPSAPPAPPGGEPAPPAGADPDPDATQPLPVRAHAAGAASERGRSGSTDETAALRAHRETGSTDETAARAHRETRSTDETAALGAHRETGSTGERAALPAGADAPAAAHAATRRTRVVRILDDPGVVPEQDAADRPSRITRTVGEAPERGGDDDEVLDPAAVGARYIEPAEATSPLLTPARIVVAVALLLLFAALVAILLGAGIV